MKRSTVEIAIALAALLAVTSSPRTGCAIRAEAPSASAAEDKPLTIKDVMRFTMTQGLCQKVIKNKADDAEKKRLVELFEKMAELTPPAGDVSAWKAKAAALVAASKEIAQGKPSHGALAKAANCTACHKDHRPKQ